MEGIEPRFEIKRNNGIEDALARQDAVAYFNICLNQGREPEEDPSLYDLGRRIVRGRDLTDYTDSYQQGQAESPSRRVGGYDAFLKGAQGFNVRDYFSQVEGKRTLLVRCFPNQAEKQKWDRMSNGKIGRLFEIMLNASKKRKSS